MLVNSLNLAGETEKRIDEAMLLTCRITLFERRSERVDRLCKWMLSILTTHGNPRKTSKQSWNTRKLTVSPTHLSPILHFQLKSLRRGSSLHPYTQPLTLDWARRPSMSHMKYPHSFQSSDMEP